MMKAFVFAACVAVALAHSHDHGDHDHSHSHNHDDGSSDVVVLTGEGFEAFVAEHTISLIEFYAPWCGHCKKLAPEFDEAAHELYGKIPLAKMDCTADDNKDTCSTYGVRGYPTLKIFRNDGSEPAPYEHGRTATDIVKFMLKATEPSFKVLGSAEEVKAMTDADFTVLAFLAAAEGPEYDTFVKVAAALRSDYSFAVVTDAAVAAEYGASVPGLAIHKPFDTEKVLFAGDFDEAAITEFVGMEAFPLLGEIGPDNYSKYVDRKVPVAWFFLDYTADNNDAVQAEITEAAKDFKGQLSFVHLDGVRWAEHAKTFGITSPPGFCIQDTTSKKMYKHDGELTTASIKAHAAGMLDGSVEPTVKSQEIPEKNDGPVFVLVGKNFESVVYDPTKDVLVEFYAPWCGHCKSLSPKYDKLGEQFADNENVIIAKVDSTENDTPEDISGFPTLKFYPAHADRKAVDYNGDRTTDALAEFVRANAKSTAKAPVGHDEL